MPMARLRNGNVVGLHPERRGGFLEVRAPLLVQSDAVLGVLGKTGGGEARYSAAYHGDAEFGRGCGVGKHVGLQEAVYVCAKLVSRAE